MLTTKMFLNEINYMILRTKVLIETNKDKNSKKKYFKRK